MGPVPPIVRGRGTHAPARPGGCPGTTVSTGCKAGTAGRHAENPGCRRPRAPQGRTRQRRAYAPGRRELTKSVEVVAPIAANPGKLEPLGRQRGSWTAKCPASRHPPDRRRTRRTASRLRYPGTSRRSGPEFLDISGVSPGRLASRRAIQPRGCDNHVVAERHGCGFNHVVSSGRSGAGYQHTSHTGLNSITRTRFPAGQTYERLRSGRQASTIINHLSKSLSDCPPKWGYVRYSQRGGVPKAFQRRPG